MSSERAIWTAGLLALAAFVVLLLVFGNPGELRPELQRLTVGAVLDGPPPAQRFGSRDLRIVGFYAELSGDCVGDDGGADADVAWLQAECPLRVLLPYQPAPDADQAQLERDGIRMSARTGQPFPPRAEPGGLNVQMEQLVYVGHFDDPAAERCLPERRDRCRNTFVAEDYDGLLR